MDNTDTDTDSASGTDSGSGFEIEGFPLSDLGLDRALILAANGSTEPFKGFASFGTGEESLRDCIKRCIGENNKLVNDALEELILPDITLNQAMKISIDRGL